MKPSRIQFSLRAIFVVIALIALNLSAGVTSWQWYPPEGWHEMYGKGSGLGFWLHDDAGLTFVYHTEYNSSSGYAYDMVELSRRVYITPGQASSALRAAVSLTFLIPAVLFLRGSVGRVAEPAGRDRGLTSTTPRLALIAGLIAVIASLVGLNRAAAAYRPPSASFRVTFGRTVIPTDASRRLLADLFGGCPKALIVRVDGRTAVSHHVDASDIPFLAKRMSRQFPLPGREYTMESATIDCGIDDSVVAYGGTYDHKLSEPKVIRAASRSLFDIWWLPIASAAITVYVLLDLGWRLMAHFRAATARGRFTPRGARS